MAAGGLLDDVGRLRVPAEHPQARGELDLGAVPQRLAQTTGEGLLVERHRRGLVAGGVERPGVLEGDPGVTGVGGVEGSPAGDPLGVVVELPQGRDLALGLVLAARPHDLAPDGVRVVGDTADLGEPGGDGLALGVAHDGADVAVGGGRDEGLQPRELGRVRRDVGDTRPGEADPQVGLELLHRPSAQVVLLVRGDDVVGAQPGHLAEGLEDVVGAVAAGAQRQVDPAPGRDEAPAHVEQGLEPGLVVREVDDDGGRTPLHRNGVRVHPAGVLDVVGAEGPQPGDDAVAVEAEPEGGGRSCEGVEDVVVRQPRERHRQVDDPQQPVGRPVGEEHRDVAVEDRRGPAAGAQRLADGGRVGVGREHPRAPPGTAAHRPHPRVLTVEDDPPGRLGDPRDDRLDLGELVDGVDALEAEVVGRHVRHDGDVVVGDTHPAQQHPAARRLEDADLHAGGLEHRSGTGRPGVVAGLDDLALDEDAVGRAPPGAQAGGHRDVREEPGRRRLPVGPGDRHDGDVGGEDARRIPLRCGRDHLGGGRHGSGPVPALVDLGEDPADGVTERLRATAVAPDERADDDVGLRGGTGADTQAARPGLDRHRASRALDDPQEGPLPLLAARSARLAAPQAGGRGQRPHRVGGGRQEPRQLERHLHGGTREVQVGALEEADLAGPHPGAGRGVVAGHERGA